MSPITDPPTAAVNDMAGQPPIKVGLCLLPRKHKKMNWADVISYCAQHGVYITEVDMTKDLASQGPYDVIIHKVNNVLDFSEQSKEIGARFTQILREYTESLDPRETCIIDPVSLTLGMADRRVMTEMLDTCAFQHDGVQVRVPKSVLLQKGMTTDQVTDLLTQQGIQFPILAKPVDAQCNDDAHNLALVFGTHGIPDMQLPCLAQEFCNHGGKLFKVFMIGNSFRMCERPSIRNMDAHPDKPTIFFDTRNISKTNKPHQPELHGADPQTVDYRSCDDDPNLLNRSVCRKIVDTLRQRYGVTLAGLDIIVEESTGDYGIIDMNYFPGYDGVRHHFAEDLVTFLRKTMQERTLKN